MHYTLIKLFNNTNNCKQQLTLLRTIGRGVSSTIWTIREDSRLVVKVFHDTEDYLDETRIVMRIVERSTSHCFYGLVTSRDSGLSGILMTYFKGGGVCMGYRMRRVGEYTCARFMRTLLIQLRDIHAMGIVHNDIKVNNIVIDHHTSTPVLIDYSHSVLTGKNSSYYGKEHMVRCGNYSVQAPEVLLMVEKFHKQIFNDAFGEKLCYTQRADMFSLGCTLYCMLCGHYPFGLFKSTIENIPLIRDIIHDGAYASRRPFIELHPITKDFIQRLLQWDRRKRMGTTEALSHPYILQLTVCAEIHARE